ncbi:bifunctional cobalt-precorrin-7 (C(5))-methyltransferase/cobalt-precorrin-6B (C(15))-methyltransferase [Marinomonas fungiae]|uniref:Precorrin-6Y C5,15-methyltransferase (Decarboxylating) n=1 Tax=Marinomonas fungiae TaxID=1137284 RepID=A0A0K6IM39_9GAMM|nr:bifunctional cobalt-precorrin-7 (C(5))-methyltransferase/cobalt-precorrin-6B (C(15))-methyltransferase [Marinomonas fungiae]CUB04392.1 precorrin-6Y C5,15-methyltransferase (decarboxylating) [Marinomonas fungiae]
MKIHVIGLGINEQAQLPKEAQDVLAKLTESDKLVGSERQLSMVKAYGTKAQTHVLPKLNDLKHHMDEWASLGVERVAILASGDPLYYGIGAWVHRSFADQEVRFYPNVSSIQAACHRLGISLQNAQVFSVHGRPLASIRTQLHPSKTLLLLTDKTNNPQAIAKECIEMGLGLSELFVCERLGYEHERVTRYTANSLAHVEETFDPLNVVIVNTSAQSGRLPSTPGFKDGLFITDKGDGQGMITKREVRLAVLSYLGVEAKEVVWDIGAGCGGVSVELAYWNPETEVYAIEHHETRLTCLEANREHFGVVKNLHVVHGRAPEAFANLPAPKRVFIGGSDGEMSELLDRVWQRLPLGGVLLVNAVTDATTMEAMAFLAKRDAAQDAYDESSTIQIYRSERLAGKRIRRPHLPVSLWRFEKCLPGERS